jgi:F0F1-type ATP synthase assembly protein I
MNEHNPKNPPVATLNQSLVQGAKIGLQIGCAGVVLTLGALLLGLWLDGQLHTKPWATLALLLASMPISVYVVFRLAQRAAYLAQRRDRHSDEDEPSL